MNNEFLSKVNSIIIRSKEQGRVLPVSEAFRLYPVEEEEHKGRLENIISAKRMSEYREETGLLQADL